jgi:cysteine desulfurase/selenocysteine lyase
MLGPTASGGLYGRSEVLEEMDVFFGGGEMILEVHEQESTYKPPPHKFEAGTPNIAQEIGLAAAVDYLEALGMEAVASHDRELVGYTMERLGSIDGIRVFGAEDPAIRGASVSFWMEGAHPHDVAQILDREGVAVRAGHHCAQILMRRLGVPATARASFNVYNTLEDVDALAAALGKVRAVFG